MAHLADMSIRLEKTWMDLNGETIASLPAQLGVYHVADANGTVLSVGYAGVDNDLFYEDKTMMLFGDGKKMMNQLNSAFKDL